MRRIFTIALAGALLAGTAHAGSIINNGTIISDADVALDWDISGNGQFTGEGMFHFSGTTNPGNSPGTMTYDADSAFELDHTLFIELAGLGGVGGTDYDLVSVVGDASLTLGGTVAFDYYGDLDATDISAGESFTFVTADPGASVLGSFANYDFTLAPLLNGLFWEVIYGQNSVTLAAAQEEVLQREPGDDFPAPIPEPATVGLLGLGLVALIARNRKHIRL